MQIQENESITENRKKVVTKLTRKKSHCHLNEEDAEEIIIQLERLAEISLRHLVKIKDKDYEP